MAQQIITFITHHWLHVGFLVIVIGAVIWYELHGHRAGVPFLSPQQVTLLLNRQDAVIIDIRDSGAYEKGHILGAINIMAKEITNGMTRLDKYKDKPLIVCCSMGQQAQGVAQKLIKDEFADVKVLAGGISAWTSANLPLSKE